MNEDSVTPSLPARALQHYSENGLRHLAGETVRYLSRQIIQSRALSTAEFEQLARSRGSIWYTEHEEPLQITPPDHDRLRTAFADYPTEFHPTRAFVCELPDCHLIERGAMAMYRGERLLPDTTGDWFARRYFDSSPGVVLHALKSRLGTNPDRVDQLLFPLVCLNPSYYHWLTEFLPKLRLLELYRDETGRSPTLLIESNPRDFVVEALELAGYGSDHYLTWDHRPRKVETLVTASHRPHRFDHEQPSRSDYRPSRADFEWLRDRMRSGIPDSDGGGQRRIYISRQHADRGRKLVNDTEVLTELRSRGFEAHVLEGYSFERQVQLFVEADVIAGPHGAGLANMLFADDPLVVELFPETVLKPHFYYLASIMGFEYEALVTDSMNDDLYVDVERLQQRLDELGI